MLRLRPSSALPLALVLMTLDLAGCSSRPEQPILNQFFTASRLRDRTSLDDFALVMFDPATQGTVNSFSIASVSPETHRALNIKALVQATSEAQAAVDDFNRRRYAYQSENIDAIRRVLKAEEAHAALKGKDAEVQADWTKLRDEGGEVDKRLSEARDRLKAETGAASLSVYTPLNPVDITRYDGEVISKEVMVSASVKQPDGRTLRKNLAVTMIRAELKGTKPVSGKWVITSVKEASAPGATKTS
ncbi:MAG: hypothetical protein ACM3SQ_08355 [Betaproteobacteria bacterium]